MDSTNGMNLASSFVPVRVYSSSRSSSVASGFPPIFLFLLVQTPSINSPGMWTLVSNPMLRWQRPKAIVYVFTPTTQDEVTEGKFDMGSAADNILSIHSPAVPDARGLGSIGAGQQILPGSFSVLN
ncbi:hypothetical protein CFAM422_002314 [Trichoderma lentiforme]|uniref:Uncharacterized protein n=1 Tax=Trichoderma lentiforme TaxID=1567552 RepID=A0A9P5CF03_9HYPO|nr:hypothetical protein CFAM422_002314 [Trichoderma lentiforme]